MPRPNKLGFSILYYNPTTRLNTWWHCTVRVFTFISKGYGGRCYRFFVTIDSGVLELPEPNDAVMVDKGFPNIVTQWTEKQSVLVMPPFATPNVPNSLNKKWKKRTKLQVYAYNVERVIQRIKTHGILNNRINIDLLPHLDKIMHICSVLVNMQT